jgi:Sec-independent protein translocase protein TatA
MLENWIGEILLVFLLIFLICPRDIPKIMRAIGRFIGSLSRYQERARALQQEIMDELDVSGMKEDVDELRQRVDDLKADIKKPRLQSSSGGKKRKRKTAGPAIQNLRH